MLIISYGTSLTLDPMDTQVGLVALAPIGRGLCRVLCTVLSTVPVRATGMVKNKVSNLA